MFHRVFAGALGAFFVVSTATQALAQGHPPPFNVLGNVGATAAPSKAVPITSFSSYKNPAGTTYAVTALDYGQMIGSAAAGGTLTATLPSNAAIVTGFQVGFVRNGGNNLVITTDGIQRINMPTNGTDPSADGAVVSTTLSTANDSILLRYDGSGQWRVVGGTPTALVPYNQYSGELSQQFISQSGHQLLWADMNPSMSNWTSAFWGSPSAASVQAIGMGGVAAPGVTLTLTFYFSGAGLANCAAGCTVTYTTIGADNTVPKIAIKIANVLAVDTRFVTAPVAGKPLGGGLPGPMVQTPLDAAGGQGNTVGDPKLYFEWRADVPVRITATTTGGVTITPDAACAVACILPLEGAPGVAFYRTCGTFGCAPAPNSNLLTFASYGPDSTRMTSAAVQYGGLVNQISNSTTATLASSWTLSWLGPNPSGTYGGNGITFGPGAMRAFGSGYSLGDTGGGTANLVGYYINGAANLKFDGSNHLALINTFAGNSNILFTPAGTGKVGVTTLNTAGVVTTDASGLLSTNATLPGARFPSLTGDVSNSSSPYNFIVTGLNGVPLSSTAATAGNILIGNSVSWATQAVSGDGTLSSAGALAINSVKGVTHPSPYTVGAIPWASAANVLQSSALLAANGVMVGCGTGCAPFTLATANNGVLITSGAGVPSISSTIPSATQDNITRTGTLVSGATGAGFTLALGTSTITGTLGAVNGGTASAYFQVTGLTATRSFLFPDASTTVLTTNAAVTAPQGGTGISVYAVGDLLYASTTTALSKLADVATGNALISGGVGVAPAWGKIASSHLNITTTSCTGQFVSAISATVGGTCSGLTPITNSLAANVALNNIVTYFDGPSIAQGTSGTWFSFGTVSITGATNDSIVCKLWDGTTIMASATAGIASSSAAIAVSLSGYLAAPAGNIKISCIDASGTTGSIRFNDSGSSKDSTLSAIRVN